MNPNRYDLWDMYSVAGKLQAQAQALSVRHLEFGIPRIHFNREVAHYIKRIADDVERGHKTAEQGIEALLQEQRDLLLQSQSIGYESLAVKPVAVQRMPAYRLVQPLPQRDPHRLLRYLHAQQLRTPEQQALSITSLARQPAPAPLFKYAAREFPKPVDLIEPGFYIVPRGTTAEKLEAELFTSPTPAILAKYKALNPGLNQIKAGQMIVLSDPANYEYQCTQAEAQLMAVADEVEQALKDLTPEEANFLADHRAAIETILTYGNTTLGIGTAMLGKHMTNVTELLVGIEDLHNRQMNQHGHLHSAAFFTERKQLFTQLDSHLTSLTKKTLGIPEHPKLKTALGISSSSMVHRRGRAGGRHMNPGYATYLKSAATASKFIQAGGWVGTAMGGVGSYMKVQDVCTAGNAEDCKKVRYTEGGGFIGGVAGGVGAGLFFGTVGTTGICLAIGVPTAGVGTLVCGIVVVGVGSLAAGALGGVGGEAIGEVIYEIKK